MFCSLVLYWLSGASSRFLLLVACSRVCCWIDAALFGFAGVFILAVIFVVGEVAWFVFVFAFVLVLFLFAFVFVLVFLFEFVRVMGSGGGTLGRPYGCHEKLTGPTLIKDPKTRHFFDPILGSSISPILT